MDHLVRRAAAGDADAFAALMHETTPSVRTIVGQYARCPEDVNDVLQDVYIRVFRRVRTIDDPARFRSWLYAIARNAGLDHVRRTRRRPAAPIGTVPDVRPDPRPGPEELAELRDLAVRIRRGAARLAPRDTTLLAVVTRLDLGPADVAGRLGMSQSAAKAAVHRARRRLRDAMERAAPAPAPAGASRSGRAAAELASRCGELDGLVREGALVDAALHARSCARCGTRAPAPACA